MFKKLLLGGVLIVAVPMLVGSMLFGRGIWSYMSTAYSEMKTEAKDMVPIEWELKRARHMITKLEPVIAGNRTKIVREEIEVAKLQRQVQRNQELLAKCKREMLQLRDDLESGSTQYVYSGRTYSAEQVKADLANRFKHYKTLEATTAKLQKIVDIRTNKLEAARRKVEEMLAAKRQLEVDVENLEARLEMIRVAEAASEFSFDNSELARTREVVSDITTRLDVTERMLNTQVELYDRIPLDEESEQLDSITEDVTSYFENRSADKVAASGQP